MILRLAGGAWPVERMSGCLQTVFKHIVEWSGAQRSDAETAKFDCTIQQNAWEQFVSLLPDRKEKAVWFERNGCGFELKKRSTWRTIRTWSESIVSIGVCVRFLLEFVNGWPHREFDCKDSSTTSPTASTTRIKTSTFWSSTGRKERTHLESSCAHEQPHRTVASFYSPPLLYTGWL